MIELVNENNSILKIRCNEFDFASYSESITTFEYLSILAKDMFEMIDVHDGIGLSAPQIGLNFRIFAMKIDDEKIICINPIIESSSDESDIDKEGCLSFPDLILNIKRPIDIVANYQTPDGSRLTRTMSGIMARCYQHELDHIDGITFDTRSSKLGLKMAKTKRQKYWKKLNRGGYQT